MLFMNIGGFFLWIAGMNVVFRVYRRISAANLA